MKKALSLILCLLFVASALCGCGKEKKTVSVTKKDGVITTADELLELSKNPSKEYKLGANIDLGGKEWKPVKDFSGTLTGVWGGEFNYTISNFKLKASKSDKAVGFFATLSGKIENVNFKDVKLELADGFSGKAGVVAGESKVKIENIKAENCTVKGNVASAKVGLIAGSTEKTVTSAKTSGEMTLTASGDTFAGGVVGHGDDVKTSDSACFITFTANGGSSEVGGLIGNGSLVDSSYFGGKLNLTANGSAKLTSSQFTGSAASSAFDSYANGRELKTAGDGQIIYGTYTPLNNAEAVFDCVTRDLNNLEEKVLGDAEYAMRKIAVDKMYDQCSIAWSPVIDMSCSPRDTSHFQEYKKGEWYFGLPYTHKCGSVERMRANLDKDGRVSSKIKAKNWDGILGNDCSDCVFWALHAVSPNVTFELTNGMVCENGLIAVGDYEIKKDETMKRSSKATCKGNSDEVMFESYAKLLMGDAIILGPAGHTRLVAENAYVYRNADGSIDGERSYIVTHEQGAGTKALPERHTTCRLYGKYTFQKLKNTGYLPITIPDYKTGKITPYELNTEIKGKTIDSLKNATIRSNYRINYVTLNIKDGDKTVVTKTVYPCIGPHLVKYSLNFMVNSEMFKDLKDGKEYEVTIYVNGKEKQNLAYKGKLKK